MGDAERNLDKKKFCMIVKRNLYLRWTGKNKGVFIKKMAHDNTEDFIINQV